MEIEVPIHLAQYIQTWNYERAALEIDDPAPPHGMKEANRDSAVDLLHSIAMLLESKTTRCGDLVSDHVDIMEYWSDR